MSHPDDVKAYLELDEALHVVRSHLINELQAIQNMAGANGDFEVSIRLSRLIDLLKRRPL